MFDGDARCDLDSVIITGDLERRASRPADYEAENQALTLLADAMSNSPSTVLQQLVELAMKLTHSDSAGISLLEPGGEQGTFRWVATTGAWAPYRDGTMPREESPCGEVIARNAVLLMKGPERAFPALLQAQPGIGEGLLAPFQVDGAPAGTLWAIMHRADRRFEAEDARVLVSLARFAAAAHQMVLALRLAQAASQKAEVRVQQLVTLAEVSTDFFGTCDLDFMPIYGNPAAMRLVGLADLEEVKRTPLREFFFPEDLPFITDEFLPRVLREGQAKVEIRFRHFVTGEPVWVDYNLVVLKDETGQATGLGTVTHDLTERKRAEKALQVSEERFRALATVGSSSVYRMSADWREMQGLDGAGFLAGTKTPTSDWVDDYIPPDERSRVREEIARAIGAKDVFELQHRVLRADGSIGWTFSRAIPLFNDAGEISEWFGAATDVTARVKADRRFTRMFQASPAPFLVLKPDAPHFTITEVNDAYLSATMRTRDEVVGRGIFEAYPDNASGGSNGSVSTLRASLEQVLSSRQPDTLPGLKYDIARPDGTFEERWWTPVNSAVLDDDGEVEALIHNANDVTEARQVEAALRESQARLAAAFESVPVGAAVIDLVGSAILTNAEYRRFLPNGVIPSRDSARRNRWRSWDAQGKLLGPEDYPSARAMRGERVVPGLEMLYTDDDGREIWTSVATVPTCDVDGRVTGQVSVIGDIDALKRSTEALRDSETRFRQFSDASANILWIRDAATMRMAFASPAFDRIYGMPGRDRGGDNSLRSWARRIEPENRATVIANFRRIRAGERVEQEFRFRRATDGALRWVQDTAFSLSDLAGNVRWIAGVGADITDAKEAADRQGVLVAELQHRTRNLIGVVRSLADRTLGNAASLSDFQYRFRLRLAALSRVQGLLSHLSVGDKVAFDELLRSELAAHGATGGMADKVNLEGPAGVPLRSGSVQTFALALHELATNAVKYGALAAPDGRLSVRWHVLPATESDPPYLSVQWQESGVDMRNVNARPAGGGYGRELIERALPYQLKAKTIYELGVDGVRCRIDVPIARALDREGLDVR